MADTGTQYPPFTLEELKKNNADKKKLLQDVNSIPSPQAVEASTPKLQDTAAPIDLSTPQEAQQAWENPAIRPALEQAYPKLQNGYGGYWCN